MCSKRPTESSHRPLFFFSFVNGVLFPVGEAQKNLEGLTPRRAQTRQGPAARRDCEEICGTGPPRDRGDGGRRSAGGTHTDTQAGGGPGGGSPAPPETPASNAGRRSLGGTGGRALRTRGVDGRSVSSNGVLPRTRGRPMSRPRGPARGGGCGWGRQRGARRGGASGRGRRRGQSSCG